MPYQVQLKQFQGPLDLLLELIEEKKLDIVELSLAEVADQYLDHVASLQEQNPDQLADFLVVASQLILVKSRALLPMLELTTEEEESVLDLQRRLLEYKKFKEKGLELKSRVERKRWSYPRPSYIGYGTIFSPPENVTAQTLLKSYQGLIDGLPTIEDLPEEVMERVVSLGEKIVSLEKSLQKRVEMSFSELKKDAGNKTDVKISFLAMLELIKNRILQASQGKIFSDITIKKAEKDLETNSHEAR